MQSVPKTEYYKFISKPGKETLQQCLLWRGCAIGIKTEFVTVGADATLQICLGGAKNLQIQAGHIPYLSSAPALTGLYAEIQMKQYLGQYKVTARAYGECRVERFSTVFLFTKMDTLLSIRYILGDEIYNIGKFGCARGKVF